jgi:hypothetical protein
MGREQDGRTPEGEKGRGKVCLKYRMGRSIVDNLLQTNGHCRWIAVRGKMIKNRWAVVQALHKLWFGGGRSLCRYTCRYHLPHRRIAQSSTQDSTI